MLGLPRPFAFLRLFCFTIASHTLFGQEPAESARQWRTQHQAQILQGFVDLLSIPNVAADAANLQRNADTLAGMLRQRHFDTQLFTAAGVPPVVFGEHKTPGAQHTIVFYAHYDGQPVTPSEWRTPPFVPTLREVNGEQRIYARSAGDDKAAIYAQLMALDALQAANIPLRANIRFVWEGEEEAGSGHLEQILSAHRDLVHGDVWLVCDGPVDQSRKQTLVFGARGDTHLEITVYGPNHGLHSGHYGNWAPNPALMLAQLLAGMKDDQGHVLIPHFYDGIVPLSPLEKKALAQAPVNDDALRQELSLGHVDGGGAHLLELLNLPTLNINGLSAGQTGARATNVIPPTATADLDLRLVVGIDWQQQQQRVIDYIRQQGYFMVDAAPDKQTLLQHSKVAFVKRDAVGYNAVRTPMDLPIAEEVVTALKNARGTVVEWPTMGGSVPLGAMERAAGSRTISVPIANHDDNQHTFDENLRLQNLWDGIETMAALLAMR
jgi:acetylornithine deacetylase/succinyl-diaminopimelate desuccinylase-like protein